MGPFENTHSYTFFKNADSIGLNSVIGIVSKCPQVILLTGKFRKHSLRATEDRGGNKRIKYKENTLKVKWTKVGAG